MKPFFLVMAMTLLTLGCGMAQAFTYHWTATNSPQNSFRFDDMYFLNADTGWAVNFAYGNEDGYVARTYDGGATWDLVWDSVGIAFRDIGFTDALHGWIGTLESGFNPGDTVILYHTTDGGDTWAAVPNLPGPRPAGICGMQVLNDSTVYAVGRYPGPAGFYKTTDRGLTWSYTDCSHVAGGLVDLHFFHPDTGYAIGTSGNYFSGKGRVIATTDGGATWSIAHTSAHFNEICWKISFPSRNVGYVSLQAFNNAGFQYFLKTTDGGATWADLNISTGGGPTGTYNVQGIGFLDDATGWIGGDVSATYFTTDGGATWSAQQWGVAINRWRFLSDTVAFAGGEKVYRMERVPVAVVEGKPMLVDLRQNYPNPFSDVTVIEYYVTEACEVELFLDDAMGKRVAVLVQDQVDAGNHRLVWSVEGVAEGVYAYTLRIGDARATRKLVIKR